MYLSIEPCKYLYPSIPGRGKDRLLLDPDPDGEEADQDPERGRGGHGGLLLQGRQRLRQHPSQGRPYCHR